MDKVSSQKMAILKHLKKHGSITSMEAFKKYGVTRLSGIIYQLRDDNNIKTIMIETKNRYGNRVNYGKYILD